MVRFTRLIVLDIIRAPAMILDVVAKLQTSILGKFGNYLAARRERMAGKGGGKGRGGEGGGGRGGGGERRSVSLPGFDS